MVNDCLFVNICLDYNTTWRILKQKKEAEDSLNRLIE